MGVCIPLWSAGKGEDEMREKADKKIGFMTFAPEWLTGSQNLDTSNWMYT
jgi:hypothetical protein